MQAMGLRTPFVRVVFKRREYDFGPTIGGFSLPTSVGHSETAILSYFRESDGIIIYRPCLEFLKKFRRTLLVGELIEWNNQIQHESLDR